MSEHHLRDLLRAPIRIDVTPIEGVPYAPPGLVLVTWTYSEGGLLQYGSALEAVLPTLEDKSPEELGDTIRGIQRVLSAAASATVLSAVESLAPLLLVARAKGCTLEEAGKLIAEQDPGAADHPEIIAAAARLLTPAPAAQ